MFGIIISRPCEAVNVVVRAPADNEPCSEPAAPASDCISITVRRWPNMFSRPLAAHSSASSPMTDEGVIG